MAMRSTIFDALFFYSAICIKKNILPDKKGPITDIFRVPLMFPFAPHLLQACPAAGQLYQCMPDGLPPMPLQI